MVQREVVSKQLGDRTSWRELRLLVACSYLGDRSEKVGEVSARSSVERVGSVEDSVVNFVHQEETLTVRQLLRGRTQAPVPACLQIHELTKIE